MTSAWKLALFFSLGAGCAAQRHAPAAPTASGGGTVQLEEDPAPAAPPAEEESLEQQRERMRADHQLELQRLTPELRARAKAIAERNYPSTRAALQAVIDSPHRGPSSVARDAYLHPLQTLEFFGLDADMRVLVYGLGAGWTIELLAPALAKQGKLFTMNTDPNGPAEDPTTLEAQRLKALLETAPELYGKVEVLPITPRRPALPEDAKLDMVLLVDAMPEMLNAGTLGGWLTAFHKSLARRGTLAVVQARAPADADPRQSAELGYLPEAWVITRVQAAGFKLLESSEINANSRDTKDHPAGVWTLPPSYRLGDHDREKYAAIGESDRMTLKFVKIEEKPAISPFVP